MAHKYEHISTGGGFKVKNKNSVQTVINQNGKADWNLFDKDQLLMKEVDISAEDIVATTEGKLGHANGVNLIEAPSANHYVEFISAVMLYERKTASYTSGGNITVNVEGGSPVTGVVSNANSLGAGANVAVTFYPITTAGVVITVNKGLNLVSASGFSDNGGTAKGTVKVRVYYRIHKI